MALAIGAGGPSCGQPVAEAPTTQEMAWVLPGPDTVWKRGTLRIALALPLETEPGSLRVSLNGTPLEMRPVGHFTRQGHAELLAPMISAGELKARHDDLVANPRRLFARSVGALPAETLAVGENVLIAEVGLPGERRARAERRFTFRPGGRTIRLEAARAGPGGTDLEATVRVVFVPVGDAPPVGFGTGVRLGRDRGNQSFVLVRGGKGATWLPEGRYRALATGGPLDSIEEWLVPARGDASHRFVLRREVVLPDSATVDFHVHAEPSFDSLLPLEERVHTMMAGGLDLFVASDHGPVTDYGPVLSKMQDARGRIRAISGVETSFARGHWNLWPLTPGMARRGLRDRALAGLPPERQATTGVGRLFGLFLEDERSRSDGKALVPVVQLSHPRGIQEKPGRPPIFGWFDAAGFQPERPAGDLLDDPSPLAFDALEIWNRNTRELYLAVRRDWFALLDQGLVRTGVANTDTHDVADVLAGYPMNVVFLEHGVPDGPRTRTADLARAVRAGRVVGTDGPVPLLEVASGEATATPGGLLRAPEGRATVTVRVVASSWIPRGGVRVWSNGRVVASWDADPEGSGPRVLRADLDLDRDAWILAEAGDPDSATRPLPGLYGLVAPRGMAVGFTNPVLVDVDGNGTFDPPRSPAADRTADRP